MTLDTRDVAILEIHNPDVIDVEIFKENGKRIKKLVFRDVRHLIIALEKKNYTHVKTFAGRIDFQTKKGKNYYIKVSHFVYSDTFSVK